MNAAARKPSVSVQTSQGLVTATLTEAKGRDYILAVDGVRVGALRRRSVGAYITVQDHAPAPYGRGDYIGTLERAAVEVALAALSWPRD